VCPENVEGRPRPRSGATTKTTSKAILAARWHFYWKRRYPDQFRNSVRLARATSQVDRLRRDRRARR
jgi:hypothetical protein